MPTAARQKYLAKQAAKKSDLLSDTDRQAEYDKVMGQLTQISAPEVDKFETLMSEWVKDAKVRQGVIPIPAIQRALCYSLGISWSKTFVSLRSDNPEQNTNAVTTTAESSRGPKQQTTTATTDTTDTTDTTNPNNNNSYEGYNGYEDDEDEEMPQLVSPIRISAAPSISSGSTVDEPSTANATTTTESSLTQNQSTTRPINQSSSQQPQKAKKKPVFAQPAPRGSRHASRPPPAMKPKAQSA